MGHLSTHVLDTAHGRLGRRDGRDAANGSATTARR
ncbi:MAG: hydroxyisourate hydrolase [Comamonadaceae bacterium]|nr:hydroxyisourate hydrolase [Comamonadaceae bacterium]